MNLLETIAVEPWPMYSEDGCEPSWNVQITTTKGQSTTLVWSTRLGRFSRSWYLMNLRRCAPQAHRDAVRFMGEFCSEMQQNSTQTEAGQNASKPGQNSKTPGQTTGTEPGHLARAGKPPLGGLCPVVPVCPPGRDTTQAGQGQKVSEIAGGSGLTPALNNRQENFA